MIYFAIGLALFCAFMSGFGFARSRMHQELSNWNRRMAELYGRLDLKDCGCDCHSLSWMNAHFEVKEIYEQTVAKLK